MSVKEVADVLISSKLVLSDARDQKSFEGELSWQVMLAFSALKDGGFANYLSLFY